jgi:hypothetical protein
MPKFGAFSVDSKTTRNKELQATSKELLLFKGGVMAETQTLEFEELHAKTNDGINVRVLMRAVEPPEFIVEVNDIKEHKSFSGFSVEVRDTTRIMDVFRFPMRFEDIRVLEAPEQSASSQEAIPQSA